MKLHSYSFIGRTSDYDIMPTERFSLIDHIQGPLRGSRQPLTGSTHKIGTGEDAFIHFPPHKVTDVLPLHAVLIKVEESFRIRAEFGAVVYVNSTIISEIVLHHGDLIRLGENGPVLRFRQVAGSLRQHIITPRKKIYKPMKQVLDDCVECAKEKSSSRFGRGVAILASLPRDISSQASPLARVASLGVVVILIALLSSMTARMSSLESRISEQSENMAYRLGLVEQERAITADELQRVRNDIVSTSEGLTVLSKRSDNAALMVRHAIKSVVFIQASYGFRDPSGKMMRALVGLDGEPLLDSKGRMMPTIRGKGPVLDRKYTGTAFVVTPDGLMITNHHVAEPWFFDADSRTALKNGFKPVMIRMVGFLPGSSEPFDVSLVQASMTADVALMNCNITSEISSLPLSDKEPEIGQSVMLLGYPTGMRAMLARTDPAYADSLIGKKADPDFWQIATELAESGRIAPLVTRGIIGQITETTVVYDAETTHGGSGGPVIGLDGKVVAINSAIIGDFGGSNMGVPVAEARRLIRAHRPKSDK